MRVAIYIRVSTEEQAKEGFSISAQRERLTAYALSQDWNIVDYYIDDGVSAKDTNRPALNAMIKEIKESKIDVVLVYKLDRLTRSVLDLYTLLELFDKHNCKFKSATEIYDTTTAIGRLFLTLVAALAQWERENLSERVRFGMTEKVRQGEWHGSEAPFGYDYNVKTKELVINEEEASTIKEIFDLYIEGYSDRKIAIHLNNKKIPTKKGAYWGEARMRYILQNPIYMGTMRWGVRVNKEEGFEVEDAAPPIISADIFNRAKKIREARRPFHGRQATSDYIFTGVLRCVRCGGAFKGHVKNEKGVRYKSYRCINSHMKQCDMKLISERIVEYQFLEHLKKAEFDIEIEYDDTQDEKEKKEIIKKMNKDLNNISSRKKKWQYAWVNEMFDDEEFRKRMDEENKKEADIKLKLEDLQINIKEKIVDEELKKVITNAIDNWNNLDDIEKKQLIQMAVNKIVIEKVDSKKILNRAKILEIIFN